MNYLKAALTGFSMSLINTALLGSRFGTYLSYSYELRTREDIYIKIILVNDNYLVNIIDPTLFNIDIDIERNGLDFSNFNYILYNRGVQFPNFWFETPMSIKNSFIFSSSIFIPASIVGAFVKENLSSSIINSYDLNVNEHLVTASIFGTIGMLKGW